jgi:hypothetical protein
MNLRHLMLLIPVATLSVACFDDKDDEDDDEDEDEDSGPDIRTTTTGYYGTTGTTTGSTGTSTPTVTVTWGGSALSLLTAGGAGGWWFGIAQTANCDSVLCWTGEDCVYGFELSDGSALSYCHDGGDSGTSLTYGGNVNDLEAGTTVFSSRDFEDDVTYYLESDPDFGGDGSCYVWGDDISYYNGLGCNAL